MPGLDGVAGYIGGSQHHERDQRRQGRDMAHGQRGLPHRHRHQPGLAIAPDDQGKAQQGQRHVEPLLAHLAQGRDGAGAPVIGDDAHRVAPPEKSRDLQKRKTRMNAGLHAGYETGEDVRRTS